MNDIHKVNPVFFIFSGHAGVSLVGNVVECLRLVLVEWKMSNMTEIDDTTDDSKDEEQKERKLEHDMEIHMQQ